MHSHRRQYSSPTIREVRLTTYRMWQEIRKIFKQLSEADDIRAVILSGAGDRAFSAGLDITWASNDETAFNPSSSKKVDGARKATAIRRLALDFQDCISAIELCEKRESFAQ